MLECVLEPNFYEFQDRTLYQLDDIIYLLGKYFNREDGNKCFIIHLLFNLLINI